MKNKDKSLYCIDSGIIVINKKVGMTSMDVIRQLKRRITCVQKNFATDLESKNGSQNQNGVKNQNGLQSQDINASDKQESTTLNKPTKRPKIKIGHAGTLDPMAQGVLPILIGEATKFVSVLHDLEKEYIFTVKFGEHTDSYDATGKILEQSDVIPSYENIVSEINHFIGELYQVPPNFSACKVDGKRAYDLARNDVTFCLEAKKITVYDFKLLEYEAPFAKFILKCGSGTYVRSIAVDFAKHLGALCHVTELIRSTYWKFSLDDAHEIDSLKMSDYFRQYNNKKNDMHGKIIPEHVTSTSECQVNMMPNEENKHAISDNISLENDVCENIMQELIPLNKVPWDNKYMLSDDQFEALIYGMRCAAEGDDGTYIGYHGEVIIGLLVLEQGILCPKRMIKFSEIRGDLIEKETNWFS